MTNAILKRETVQPNVVPMPPYDGEHLEALGKKFCRRLGVSNDLFEDAVHEFVLGGLIAAKRADYPSASVRKYQHKYGEYHVMKFLAGESLYHKRNPKSLNQPVGSGDRIEIAKLETDDRVTQPQASLLEDEQMQALRSALGELSARDRELMTLRFVENWSYARLGKHFKMSHETVRRRTMDLLETLREKLGKNISGN